MKKKYPICIIACASLVLLSSCGSMMNAMTPQTKVVTDDFDGSLLVRQESVSASSSYSEDLHTLAFDWSSRTPDIVFLTAGVKGIHNVNGLEFNAGGNRIVAKTASTTTEYGDWSTRRFAVSFRDFEKIATASVVKMKVVGNNSYGVSSFGPTSAAPVSVKLPNFLQKVRAHR